MVAGGGGVMGGGMMGGGVMGGGLMGEGVTGGSMVGRGYVGAINLGPACLGGHDEMQGSGGAPDVAPPSRSNTDGRAALCIGDWWVLELELELTSSCTT